MYTLINIISMATSSRNTYYCTLAEDLIIVIIIPVCERSVRVIFSIVCSIGVIFISDLLAVYVRSVTLLSWLWFFPSIIYLFFLLWLVIPILILISSDVSENFQLSIVPGLFFSCILIWIVLCAWFVCSNTFTHSCFH